MIVINKGKNSSNNQKVNSEFGPEKVSNIKEVTPVFFFFFLKSRSLSLSCLSLRFYFVFLFGLQRLESSVILLGLHFATKLFFFFLHVGWLAGLQFLRGPKLFVRGLKSFFFEN